MLENVVADMERGDINYALVGHVDEFGHHLVEVWRKGIRLAPTTIYHRAWRAAQQQGETES